MTLWGQGWEQMYGGDGEDWGYSVQQTTDGGYIITGKTHSFGNGQSDLYLIKTDNNGDTLWTKTFGYDGFDGGFTVKQTNDNGFIIVGWFDLIYDRECWLIKTNEFGEILWNKLLGGYDLDFGLSVQQTQDGGYIVTGYTQSIENVDDKDLFLIKTDENGNEQWSQTFGGQGDERGLSVQQTNDGGYIITGLTTSFGFGQEDLWLIKTDENGIEEWNRTHGDIYDGGGTFVQQTNDGGFIISGGTSITSDNSETNILLLKTDENGNEEWNRIFEGDPTGLGMCVQQTLDEGYIVIGILGDNIHNLNWDFDVVNHSILIKTDENGNELWSQILEETSYCFSIQQTIDDGFIIVGSIESLDNDSRDVYLIKTDDQGNITSTFEIPLPNPNRKIEKTINLKGQEIKPKTNQPIIEIFDDGSVEKKLIIEK